MDYVRVPNVFNCVEKGASVYESEHLKQTTDTFLDCIGSIYIAAPVVYYYYKRHKKSKLV